MLQDYQVVSKNYLVCDLSRSIHCPKVDLYYLKGLGKGPFKISKGDLYKTFIALKVTFHKGDLSVVKVL